MQLISSLFGWASVIFRLAVAFAPFLYVASLFQAQRFAFILEHNVVVWSFVWLCCWSLLSFSPLIWSTIPTAAALEKDDQEFEPDADEPSPEIDSTEKFRKPKFSKKNKVSDEQSEAHPFVDDNPPEWSSTPQLQLF